MEQEKSKCVRCGKKFTPNEHLWWCDACWKKRMEGGDNV